MPREFQLYEFEIRGESQPLARRAGYRKGGPNDNFPEDANHVTSLNENADQIGLEIEKEIAHFLRSSATIHAEVRFYEGSIVVEGTILILSWLGPLALSAGKKAFEAEFSRVVQVGVQRVLQRWIQPLAPSAQPMRIEVETQESATASALNPPPEAQSFLTTNLSTIMAAYIVASTIMLLLLLVRVF
jgi:hypothetical protein